MICFSKWGFLVKGKIIYAVGFYVFSHPPQVLEINSEKTEAIAIRSVFFINTGISLTYGYFN
jgi:hypothetical protein